MLARSVLRFSANLHFLFPELPFLERFAAARRAGFTAVEFPDPYAYPLPELARRLHDNQLECVLINFPMGGAGEKGFACLPDRKDELRASITRAMEAMGALGCPRANCMAGLVPPVPELDLSVLHATLVANLRLAAKEFAEAGLELTTEALNTHDVPGFYLHDVTQALALVREVAAPNLRFQFDLYHMWAMNPDEASLRASLRMALPLVGHVQVADHPGRHQPGTGTLPFRALFAELEAGGYEGWIGAEYHPLGPTASSFGWRDEPSLR
jgi:hydroxypyruvate isomerase